MLVVDSGITVITALGLFVRAKMGFGFSLVVVPLISLMIGFSSAVLFAIVLEVVSSLSMAWLLRSRLRLLDAGLLKVGSFVGLGLGWLGSRFINDRIAAVAGMSVVIGTCVCVLALGDIRRRGAPSSWSLPILGMLSGLLNYWTSLSGPPVVLAYARTDVDATRIVATLTGYFSLLYLYTFGVELAAGRYEGFKYWPIAAICAMGTIACIRPVKILVDKISVDFHRLAVLGVAVSAAVVLVQELLSH